MLQIMVGLLAASGAAIPVLAGLAHTAVALVIIALAAGATAGSAACLALSPKKKYLQHLDIGTKHRF